MKKTFTILASLLLAAAPALAGGILTNTNQSVAFLRNPARDAAIGLDGVYTNPAGVAFMPDGFHLALNWQNAHQTRTVTSAYGPLFALNADDPAPLAADGMAYRRFKGVADAPVLPSLQAAYNLDCRWSFQLGFAISGGGGKCEFDDGLGSFEGGIGSMIQAYSGQMVAPNAVATGRYAFDSRMKGRQYYLGTTIGAAYKPTEQIAVYAGLRLLYGTARYEAAVTDIQLEVQPVAETSPSPTYTPIPGAPTQLTTVRPDVMLDCSQSGLGIAPILGIDYHVGRLNLAAKYDFKVRMRLKNDNADPNFPTLLASLPSPQVATMLGKYADGNKVAEDSPALLAIGAQYELTDQWRVMAGYHHFFDVDTRQWTKDDLGDTQEWNLGTEYDVNSWLQVSAGVQKTNYDFADSYMNDMSFNVSSWTFGLGVGVQVSQAVKFNAAYFQTNYDTMDVTTMNGAVSNAYTRTNRVLGIGCEITL